MLEQRETHQAHGVQAKTMPKGLLMQGIHAHINNNPLLRLTQIKQLTGLSKSSIYLFMKSGNFPSPIKIGKRAVAWRSSDIDTWLHTILENPSNKNPSPTTTHGESS